MAVGIPSSWTPCHQTSYLTLAPGCPCKPLLTGKARRSPCRARRPQTCCSCRIRGHFCMVGCPQRGAGAEHRTQRHSGHTPAARLLAWPKHETAAGLAAEHRQQGCAGPLGKAGFWGQEVKLPATPRGRTLLWQKLLYEVAGTKFFK